MLSDTNLRFCRGVLLHAGQSKMQYHCFQAQIEQAIISILMTGDRGTHRSKRPSQAAAEGSPAADSASSLPCPTMPCRTPDHQQVICLLSSQPCRCPSQLSPACFEGAWNDFSPIQHALSTQLHTGHEQCNSLIYPEIWITGCRKWESIPSGIPYQSHSCHSRQSCSGQLPPLGELRLAASQPSLCTETSHHKSSPSPQFSASAHDLAVIQCEGSCV